MTLAAPVVHGKTVRLSKLVRRITCNNPGVFTGPGTNTYLIGAPASGRTIVLDPGPDDQEHIKAIARAGRDSIKTIVVTHTHPDHSPGVKMLKELTGATVIGFDSRDEFATDIDAGDGYVLKQRGVTLRAVHTPGHASNHLCWHLAEENLLFSGDHVMAGSTVVISPLDGDMQQYLDNLEKVRRLRVDAIAPAHGPVLTDPDAVLSWYVAHRLERERLVLLALARRGSATVADLVKDVYTDVPKDRYPIAQFSLWAHLRKLRAEGFASSRKPDDLNASWQIKWGPLRRR
ncbi:MAG TPA: MBL fold metallo-hydrolase [Acidimicrobiales bacterium]|nr:MBL fold metallo-hydrolase [Acidimicrobiales bacterium]